MMTGNRIAARATVGEELSLWHPFGVCGGFLIPPKPTFPRGTYKVEHFELGEFDLLLVPHVDDDEGSYYVASFNHTIHPTR